MGIHATSGYAGRTFNGYGETPCSTPVMATPPELSAAIRLAGYLALDERLAWSR